MMVPPGQHLATQPVALNTAVTAVLANLEQAAITALGESWGNDPDDARKNTARALVNERWEKRYRRGEGFSFVAARANTRGREACDIIREHLIWLAGGDPGAPFPGQKSGTADAARKLRNLRHYLDRLRRDQSIVRFLSDGFAPPPERVRLQRALVDIVELIDAARIDAEAGKPQGRKTKAMSDATAVLLAGCWWLATGKWPATSADGRGRFYEWAHTTLRTLRPDLVEKLAEPAMMPHALRRQRALVTPLPGPWLAWNVIERNLDADDLSSQDHDLSPT